MFVQHHQITIDNNPPYIYCLYFRIFVTRQPLLQLSWVSFILISRNQNLIICSIIVIIIILTIIIRCCRISISSVCYITALFFDDIPDFYVPTITYTSPMYIIFVVKSLKCEIKNVVLLKKKYVFKLYSTPECKPRFGRHDAHKRHDTMGEVSYSTI